MLGPAPYSCPQSSEDPLLVCAESSAVSCAHFAGGETEDHARSGLCFAKWGTGTGGQACVVRWPFRLVVGRGPVRPGEAGSCGAPKRWVTSALFPVLGACGPECWVAGLEGQGHSGTMGGAGRPQWLDGLSSDARLQGRTTRDRPNRPWARWAQQLRGLRKTLECGRSPPGAFGVQRAWALMPTLLQAGRVTLGKSLHLFRAKLSPEA